MKKALIFGISGQDGSYLSRLLLSKGYEVCGTSRDVQTQAFYNLRRLGIRDKISLESVAITDFRSILQFLLKTPKGNPAKAKKNLLWQAKYRMKDVVEMMFHEEN